MTRVRQVRRPRRWDRPFGPEPIPSEVVEAILSQPAFSDIDADDFPDDLALADIIANDGRLVKFRRGDVVLRQGDWGESVFVVLSGAVRNGARDGLAGRVRKLLRGKAAARRNGTGNGAAAPASARIQILGVAGALARRPRCRTMVCDHDETLMLELRWPGLRDIRHWSDTFRERIDGLYRARCLESGLRASSLFNGLDDATLTAIFEHCRFETHGTFEWTHPYQRDVAGARGSAGIIRHEPVILEEGDYLEDAIVVHSGFARVSESLDHGERTVGYLTQGDVFGLDEIIDSRRGDRVCDSPVSLRAMGYADIIRIPAPIVERHVLPASPQRAGAHRRSPAGADRRQSMRDFLVDNRLINGTRAMAINIDRCVNCDDCVRACAATHDGIPRFVRRGPSHRNLMVAGACMHCVDPVCLIDCPTGAIRRDGETGRIDIDDATCVGCATCASACPYDNIRMEEVRDSRGAFLVDEDGVQVLRASKCDLCADLSAGPACQRACPHDALVRIDVKDTGPLSTWLERAR